ncbi:IclR family transcriptional regulator [Enteractinococcus helveticum]|uniref:IclR family transcriptional regulator n=1 Tax=Enteractinococcus helveticum TaxID=1837282 RepID=A0A1B7LUN7_9MICC|nr:IclR family transcriptional regulator [Enteractinococcus helveticum]OAV51134.1 IclR family transcriptional regulator [Enteractinococcus helveticum]
MAGGSKQRGRSVTSKVLAILSAFEHSRGSMSLTQIADQADLPLSTAYRLVGELIDEGMLARGPHGKIQLGLKLWSIAQNTGRQLRDTARPFVQDMYSLTGHTSQLAIRDGASSLYIDRVYGPRRVPRASRVGGRLPLHATAVGKVILAFSEPWVAEAYLTRDLEAFTPRTKINPNVLAAELETIRQNGYGITLDEVRVGASSIAVPVYHTGRLGCAIGLVVSSDAATEMSRHLPVLYGTSKRIEEATAHIPLETLLGAFIGEESEEMR